MVFFFYYILEKKFMKLKKGADLRRKIADLEEKYNLTK